MFPFPTRRDAVTATGGLFLTAQAQVQQPKAKAPEAYTDLGSYAPGDSVKLSISSTKCNIVVRRLGGGQDKAVWEKKDVEPGVHEIPKDASANGCRWPATELVPIGKDWPSGYYECTISTKAEGMKPLIGTCFFIVRPKKPAAETKILLQLSTNTYNAYTNYGGYSLYAYNGLHKVQGRRVSFDRPQSSQFGRWEQHFVNWAEKSGYQLDFCSNLDLELRPEILKDYKLVLSVGHDEYWSTPMRDHLEEFIGRGGNVAFFSGNTCCWQVRTEDKGRALTCWKQSFGDDPIYKTGDYKLLSTLWSHYLLKRPENTLTGVGFLWGGYHRSHGQLMDGAGSFKVHQPEHWLFEGTKLQTGDSFGAKLPDYKIVGYECDGCELVWKAGVPVPTHKDGTPENFEVLATAPARWHPDDSEWYEKWEKGRSGYAVIGTYKRGGTVVTVGTTDWSLGLKGNDPNVIQITKNVLEKLGK